MCTPCSQKSVQIDFIQLPQQWGMFGHHMPLSNDEDTHLSRTVAKGLCTIFHLIQNRDQDLHCLHHLQSSDKKSFKFALATFSEIVRFLWLKVCVLALVTVRPTPFAAHHSLSQWVFKSTALPWAESSTQHSDSQDNHRLKGFRSEKHSLQHSRASCPPSAGVLTEVYSA